MGLNFRKIKIGLEVVGFLTSFSFVAPSFGQTRVGLSSSENAIRRDTLVIENEDKRRVLTNKFWDNWFIGAGAGGQIYFGDHNSRMEFGDRVSPAFTFYFGKWFSPEIGVRAGVDGLKIYGVTQNQSHSTGEAYNASQSLEKQEFDYYNAHLDMLFNLNNIFAGYKPDRFYTISPYFGLGWMQIWESPKAREVNASAGLFNNFRLGKSLDLALDIRGVVVNDRFDGEVGGRKEEGLVTATLGLVYKFKKREWDRPSTTLITYDEAALAALRDRVEALARDNEALRKQLANSEAVSSVKVENRVLAAPILITFPINKSTVSNEAKVNLKFFASVIKEGNSNVVYKVTGYADKGTGTAQVNERLSRERAEAIFNVLVKEFGVSPSQLEVASEGGVDNMFYDDPRLSRAVITIAK